MSPELKNQIDAFLNLKNIAIAGYSRDNKQPANHIYKRFSDNGYKVFAVNPHNAEISDVKCYATLENIPEKIDGVVVCTPPNATAKIVEDCIRLDIKNVWMHRSFDNGSYDQTAVEISKKNNLNCISIGCPLMFLDADFGHKCIRWIMNISGKLKN